MSSARSKAARLTTRAGHPPLRTIAFLHLYPARNKDRGKTRNADRSRCLLPAFTRNLRRGWHHSRRVRDGRCGLRWRGRDRVIGRHGQGHLQGCDARQSNSERRIRHRAALRNRKGHERGDRKSREGQRVSDIHETRQPRFIGRCDKVPHTLRLAGRPDGSGAV